MRPRGRLVVLAAGSTLWMWLALPLGLEADTGSGVDLPPVSFPTVLPAPADPEPGFPLFRPDDPVFSREGVVPPGTGAEPEGAAGGPGAPDGDAGPANRGGGPSVVIRPFDNRLTPARGTPFGRANGPDDRGP